MTPGGTTLGQQMDRAQRNVLFVGLIALAISLIGLYTNAQHFWQSYLFAYIFWAGLTLGCLGIFFLHNVVGGNWGVAEDVREQVGLPEMLRVRVQPNQAD